MASNKNQALGRFNTHLRLGHKGCLSVSERKLPIKLSDLHDMFRVEKIEILDTLP